MKNKKGLYFVIGFVALVLIIAGTLTFFHEDKLENGILFTLSFPYQTEQDIKYNFYNQNGKMEKIERKEINQINFLLDKSDYNSSILLRKLIKDIKPSKEPSKEVGITLYNGQNKRYYFLPFQSESAKLLVSYIKDGFIHSEFTRVTNEKLKKELYTYQSMEGLKLTDSGKTPMIVDTYLCEKDECRQYEIEENSEYKIIWDGKYYYYHFKNHNKEEIKIDENMVIQKVKYYLEEEKIIGLEITTEKEMVYYNLERKEMFDPTKTE